MTNLFICKRRCADQDYGSVGGTSYIYEELAPVEDLERVRDALKDLISSHGGWLHHSYGIEERIFPEGDVRGLLCKRGKESLEILDKLLGKRTVGG